MNCTYPNAPILPNILMAPCPDCMKGEVLPGEPTGKILQEFQGAYHAPCPTGTSKRAIIYLTDAFGLPLKNCKIMADEFAKRLECDVWIPDYFNGRPMLPVDSMLKTPDRAGVKMSALDWAKLVVVLAPRIPIMISNRASVVDKRVESFIALLKEKRTYEKIGAVGYCYGGSTCIRLGSTGSVDAVVIAHPGSFTIDQVKAIKVPASWACAEDDLFFSDSLRRDAEAVFKARENKETFIDYEFNVFKGTAHGFAVRPNLDLPEIEKGYYDALNQTVDWFQKTLVV